MANKKITDLSALTSPADGDLIEIVDVSDTSESATGTNKKITKSNLVGDPLEAVVDDTTPQLGGDLDLNGNSLDFPTTPNISDCLDEDDMSSDSDTKLATQQSIKKYVDDNSADFSALNQPDSFVINGRIVPSVASDNLTVAIKGVDGNNPSASNPVYVRINNSIRSITSALSVTKNAGTNWCNAGSTELATNEIDYFVYLGYNATDGVVIGFSRYPNGRLYGDFSTTSTDEDYCAISTITNAVAGDDYVNIGRFGATLSAGAGYTWTVPTFTTKNLIQRPIYETRWLDYATIISSGSGTLTTTVLTFSNYKFTDNQLFVKASIEITTNGTGATNITLSMPWNAASTFASTGTGREWNVSGDALQCIIESTTNELTIRSYDNTYPGGDGTKHVISIDYEI